MFKLNRTMPTRGPCGIHKESVRRLCMDLNDRPCSFLDAHLNRLSKSCDGKSCFEEACVFCWSLGMGSMIQHRVLRLCIL